MSVARLPNFDFQTALVQNQRKHPSASPCDRIVTDKHGYISSIDWSHRRCLWSRTNVFGRLSSISDSFPDGVRGLSHAKSLSYGKCYQRVSLKTMSITLRQLSGPD